MENGSKGRLKEDKIVSIILQSGLVVIQTIMYILIKHKHNYEINIIDFTLVILITAFVISLIKVIAKRNNIYFILRNLLYAYLTYLDGLMVFLLVMPLKINNVIILTIFVIECILGCFFKIYLKKANKRIKDSLSSISNNIKTFRVASVLIFIMPILYMVSKYIACLYFSLGAFILSVIFIFCLVNITISSPIKTVHK